MTALSTEEGLDVGGSVSASSTNALVPIEASRDLVVAPVDNADTTVARTDDATTPAAAPTLAGAGLIAEAELAVDERRWRDALRVLGAIDSINASSVHTDGLLAIAATHVNKNRLAEEATARVRAHPRTAATHRHLAQIAIAKHRYLLADNESRAALTAAKADPDDEVQAQDWVNLAASYAGLGWFDEAADCLDRAQSMDASDSADWVVGRATNHWGMSKTWASIVGVVLFIFVGLLALAVAITVPFVAREFRMTQVDERFAALASEAWSHERWLRLAHAGGVLMTVVLWSVATQLV